MPDPTDKTPRNPLRAFADWLKGPARPGTAADDEATAAQALQTPPGGTPAAGIPERIAHYVITRKLGQGGMGVVYAARDERLGRTVAIKTLVAIGDDETARRRFWREARAAASVNHPNVTQLYDVGETQGELFIAMELLEGEPLSERLQRGAMSIAEMLPIVLGILDALAALHAGGIIHRDLKPSNVFLTPHGVKLLDFGLARTVDPESTRSIELTQTGMVMGTPRYMAPEAIAGEPLDPRGDLFAAGAIGFEMLAGRPAFAGRTLAEVVHATLYEQPPALSGSPAVTAVDHVLRRALSKRPADRPASAAAMAEELRAAADRAGADTQAIARPLTRLVVLPFRVLRPDPETDFLAFSLPDAIATSLSRFATLTVRSGAAAARFAGETPDLKALAIEADVDRVVMGSVLRSGDQLRVTAELVEAPNGTLLAAHAMTASLGDLFALQDEMVHRMVEALALPLAGPAAPLTPDAPHDARAYELYLRANELARAYDHLPQARDIYRRAVEIDPSFAPAWAQLGRTEWVIGKFIHDPGNAAAKAEGAFQRALEVNPRLAIAHKFYANFEADTGRARQALTRLLAQAARGENDPEIFAGLVHACRYAGLFEASIAAHREARRLDPHIPTSVEQTLLMICDLDRLLAYIPEGKVVGGDAVIRAIGLGLAGRVEPALEALKALRGTTFVGAFETWADFLIAWLERRPEDMQAFRTTLEDLRILDDPEAIFQEGWMFCDVGDHARGLELLGRAVTRGYFVAPTLRAARAFDPVRGEPAFQRVLDAASAGAEEALVAFRAGGGDRLLGR